MSGEVIFERGSGLPRGLCRFTPEADVKLEFRRARSRQAAQNFAESQWLPGTFWFWDRRAPPSWPVRRSRKRPARAGARDWNRRKQARAGSREKKI